MNEIRVPTEQDVIELVAVARTASIEGAAENFPEAIIVAAYTGVRLGELLALEWADVEGDELQVTKQRRRDGGTASTKNGHDRTALILGPARDALEEIPMLDPRDRIFNYSRREHTRLWGKIRGFAALEQIRWHDLRHFYATYLIDAGASDLDVALQLGHRDGGQLVRERYGHPSPARARDRLRARLAGKSPTLQEALDTAQEARR